MATPTSFPPYPTSALLLVVVLVLFLLRDDVAILASPSSSTIMMCRPGWTTSSDDAKVPIPQSRIDDGYCDCPYDDGIDEPNTSACSGSTGDGNFWAGMMGIIRENAKNDDDHHPIPHPPRKFACPRQPSLLLPYSRINDGICDCCDGADEMMSSSSSSSSSSSRRGVGVVVAAVVTCPNTCELDLANERDAREKFVYDYEVGSARRHESMRAYGTWRDKTHDEIRRLKEEEMVGIELEYMDVSRITRDAMTEYAMARVRDVAIKSNDVGETLWGDLFEIKNDDIDIIDGSTTYYDGLASLIISFCGLSAEISMANYANGSCVPLVEAGTDAGMTWHEDVVVGGGDAASSSLLPAFEKIDLTSEDAVSVYADAVMLRLEGRKKKRSGAVVAAASSSASSRSSSAQREEEKKEVQADYEPRYDSFDDDYYYPDEPEEEGRWFDESNLDLSVDELEESTGGGGEGGVGGGIDDPSSSRTDEEDYGGREEGGSAVEMISKDGKEEGGEKRRGGQHQSSSSSPDDEILVKSLLESVPLDRTLFKNRAETLLRSSPMAQPLKEDDDDGDERIVDASPSEDGSSAADEGTISGDVDAGKVDPMAMQMTKSALSRYLSQITRGESSMMSAARYVASVMRGSDSPADDMRTLAIMTMYHGDVALEDVAELIYLTCGALRSSTPDEEGGSRRRGEMIAGGDDPSSSSSSCPSPSSDICPPRMVLVGGKAHPPSFVMEAARRRCDRREGGADSGACAARDDDGGAIKFPTSVSDGYYDYYAPQPRVPDDGLTSVFSAIDSLFEPPSNILELRKREEALNGKKKSLSKRVADLEREIGDGDGGDGRLSKYGIDGEMFALRDTCHKLMYLKYEYEVCIFGSATQRDGGSKGAGGTNLGSWKAAYVEGGRRTLKWEGGTQCWNGPARSAEVSVTCGADTRLLTADEPETCRYVFTMESPIGCDEEFKVKNSL